MIHIIIAENLFDLEFVEENVSGFEALREAVRDFTPDYVADRAGIPAAQLIEAARLFARTRVRHANSGTGPEWH